MASEGYVVAFVYTSNAQLPIADATVVLFTEENGRRILLGMEITDDSGRTNTVKVSTPDRALSETPTDAQVFTDVMLAVYHPAYQPILFEHVQVFPQMTTRQNMEMQPISDDPHRRNDTQIFNTTPQNL